MRRRGLAGSCRCRADGHALPAAGFRRTVDHAVLHDEAHVLDDPDVRERIARHRDDIGEQALEQAATILD
jgi:hypothetical protein